MHGPSGPNTPAAFAFAVRVLFAVAAGGTGVLFCCCWCGRAAAIYRFNSLTIIHTFTECHCESGSTPPAPPMHRHPGKWAWVHFQGTPHSPTRVKWGFLFLCDSMCFAFICTSLSCIHLADPPRDPAQAMVPSLWSLGPRLILICALAGCPS